MNEKHQEEKIPRQSVIIASNRGPVTFYRELDGDLTYQRGSGGLVTALTGIIQEVNATWISYAISDEDKLWGEGQISLQNNNEVFSLKFISTDEAAYEGYYNQIANPLLWFLQHSMWNVPYAPVIDRDTWKAWEAGYVAVNKEFAYSIIEQLEKTPKPVLVMLQDYHLYLVANFLRENTSPRLRPTILHFTHIPWPGPEYWGVLPPTMRQAILEGLSAADVLGFQTNADALNFLRTCQTYLPRASVNYKPQRVWYRNHATYARSFPISIDVEQINKAAVSDEIQAYHSEISDLVGGCQLVLRIDRIEPSKNIVRGFQAFEEMLELYPEHRGKVSFLALLVPSRLDVEEYQDYLDALMAAAGHVNAVYGTFDWEPIRVIVGENYARAIAALKYYDVLLVNSIADGMNLVAKEGPIVNQRDGVLILSERTGAQEQLNSGAIVISPCDVYATAEAIHQALVMNYDLRAEKAARLRWLIEREDIREWFSQQLAAVEELNL
ncbi:MAG: trehalose-6-phosphate synthase [Chloroflexota bacterium]|nr:MAG: trehalose-6-phosphate synthase [Chloroflexota bacterium]